MKKFILLVSVWLGFAATATVYAQVESTQYAFTKTATEDVNIPKSKGNVTRITLPVRFAMQGGASLLIYDDPEGFVLNEDTKMLYADWSEFTNDDARLSISYTAEYTKDGEKVSIKKDNWDEWVNVWKNSNEYDLTNFSANSTDEESMGWIRKNYPDAKITITKILIRNFKDAGIVVEYGLESLNIAGQDMAVLPAKQENVGFYGGEFTVVNSGQQAFSISRFEIPEQYRGKYVRIDFNEEVDEAQEQDSQNWGLNLAFSSDAEGQMGVEGGWLSLRNPEQKVGLSRYYKIPDEAVYMNPQLWKNASSVADEEQVPWTISVAGFYLTTGIDNSAVYTDEFFPLEEGAFTIHDFGAVKSSFDAETKQLTMGGGSYANWVYNQPHDFSVYEYAVVVFNEPKPEGQLTMAFFKDAGFWGVAHDQPQIADGVLHHVIKLADINTDVSYLSKMYEVGFRSANGGTYNLSHVFLTNTLPDWENPDTRTTTAGNYGTVCFAYPAVVSGAYIYTVEGKDAVGKTLYLKPYNGVLTPGVPYLYKSIGNEEGVNFYQIKDAGSYTEATAVNGLVGCLDETVGADAGGHALHSDNTWYKIDTDVQFTNRAYLKVADVPVMTEEEAVSANVNRMMLGDWDVTGINEVQAAAPQVDDEAVYNLSGIKMDADNLPKGIYIRGGKKFIVK